MRARYVDSSVERVVNAHAVDRAPRDVAHASRLGNSMQVERIAPDACRLAHPVELDVVEGGLPATVGIHACGTLKLP